MWQRCQPSQTVEPRAARALQRAGVASTNFSHGWQWGPAEGSLTGKGCAHAAERDRGRYGDNSRMNGPFTEGHPFVHRVHEITPPPPFSYSIPPNCKATTQVSRR